MPHGIDLDPGPRAPWERVVEGARAVRAVLDSAGLESWIKTTGGKGLHVVVPLNRTVSWEVVNAFARAVAEKVEAGDPTRYVTTSAKAKRGGKIYIDYLRNGRGATAIAPWSLRAREGAPIRGRRCSLRVKP